jgi:hypothetical protein
LNSLKKYSTHHRAPEHFTTGQYTLATGMWHTFSGWLQFMAYYISGWCSCLFPDLTWECTYIPVNKGSKHSLETLVKYMSMYKNFT